jgi:hypothetical protein
VLVNHASLCRNFAPALVVVANLNYCYTLHDNEQEQAGLGGSGLRLATKKASSTAPFALSETCGVGTYKCYGEGSVGGDYQGPRTFSIDNEFCDVKFLEDSKFGLISVDITGDEGGFREYEICRPDPLNGTPAMPFPKYYCVTNVRNDEKHPTVLIDMTFTSCNSWTKIVRNLKANPNNNDEQEPGVFEVRCTKDTLSHGDSFKSYV